MRANGGAMPLTDELDPFTWMILNPDFTRPVLTTGRSFSTLRESGLNKPSTGERPNFSTTSAPNALLMAAIETPSSNGPFSLNAQSRRMNTNG